MKTKVITYLTVAVWEIISNTFKLINKPIPSIEELEELIDDNVWKLYKNGITATMNQVDSDFATNLVMKYAPTSVAELSAFVAAIRPGFASLLNHFINREEYSTGIDEIDELLEDSFHYMLYQESIMKFLVWCGIPEDETYGVIKKISKKKFKDSEIKELKGKLITEFKIKTGSIDGFDEIWQVIEDAVGYAFNASHSLSVAYDSLYGAYLKANYPLEYYTVVLNYFKNDTDKTNKITKELDYFNISLNPIKFRYSNAEYTMDKKTNSIYKGIASIKYLNEQVSNELYGLRNNQYDTFYDVLVDLTEKTSINSRQLTILIALNFFDEFGKNKKLLKYTDIFNNLYNIKQLSKSKAKKLNLPIDIIQKYSRETAKTYMDFQYGNVLKEIWYIIKNKSLSLKEQIQAELEYLSYIEFTEPRAGNDFYVVTEYKTYKNKLRPYVTLYRLKTGEQIKTKVVDPKFFAEYPFELYDVIRVKRFKEQRKNRLINGKWTKIDETEQVLNNWQVF